MLTKDIVSPVKRAAPGLEDLIKEYEKSEMQRHVYKLLKPQWHSEMRMYTENEFVNTITKGGKQKNLGEEEIGSQYNKDIYNPRDGLLIRACDQLAAFIEAYASMQHGITDAEFKRAEYRIREAYASKIICGLNFGQLYAEFD